MTCITIWRGDEMDRDEIFYMRLERANYLYFIKERKMTTYMIREGLVSNVGDTDSDGICHG